MVSTVRETIAIVGSSFVLNQPCMQADVEYKVYKGERDSQLVTFRICESLDVVHSSVFNVTG